MTRLLVSVRDAEEARQALSGGASIIDVKEPRHGSLGAADPEQWRAVRAAVEATTPLSAALGELSDAERMIRSGDRLAALQEYDFAKVGLAHTVAHTMDETGAAGWQKRWADVCQALPAGVRHVGVVYADYGRAFAPPPEAVIASAAEMQCAYVLFDTFDKQAGNLFDALDSQTLGRYIETARQAGLPIVLAGSLRKSDVLRTRPLRPDVVAVRGAVCRGTRSDGVDATLVKEFALALAEYSIL